jgi:hypothetical protein
MLHGTTLFPEKGKQELSTPDSHQSRPGGQAQLQPDRPLALPATAHLHTRKLQPPLPGRALGPVPAHCTPVQPLLLSKPCRSMLHSTTVLPQTSNTAQNLRRRRRLVLPRRAGATTAWSTTCITSPSPLHTKLLLLQQPSSARAWARTNA